MVTSRVWAAWSTLLGLATPQGPPAARSKAAAAYQLVLAATVTMMLLG